MRYLISLTDKICNLLFMYNIKYIFNTNVFINVDNKCKVRATTKC